MKTIIYLTDRSRIVSRENCERQRFLNYDFDIDGEMVGIQRKSASLPLLNGIELHEGHARLLAGEDIESVIENLRTRYKAQVSDGVVGVINLDVLAKEQTALLEAMLRAFVLTWLPRILEEYDVVSIEQPMDWNLAPGLVQKLRFDTVLRRKADGQLVILDYKSMSYISAAWAKKLERSRQTSLYISAAQELYGESVEMAYLGIVKGSYRKDTAKSSPFFGEKIQTTPFLYGYAFKDPIVGMVYQTDWTNKKGFHKVRMYEEMPMVKWVEWLWKYQRPVITEAFIFNPPFSPTPREMARVRELVVREELAYVERIGNYRNLVAKGNPQAQDYLDYVAAPMREERCFQYGEDSVCQFYDVCFNEGAMERVLEDGEFEPREAHHSREEAA